MSETYKYQGIVEILNETFAIQKKYNAIPHKVGDITMYWMETHILEYIGNHEGTTAAAIAKKFDYTPATCSEMIKKLKSRQLIERVRNESNNREYHLYLTSSGRKFYELHKQFDRSKEEEVEKNLEVFTDAQIEAYIQIQRKLINVMKKTIKNTNGDFIDLEMFM